MLTKPLISVLSPAGPDARLSVLIFHRVTAEADPLFPDDVDVRRFDKICTWLKRWFHVLPLDEAVQRLKSKTLPARAAAITFDDGYRDNREVALPILQRHDLCATFFIATGFLDGGCMWNDVVIESVRRTNESVIDLRPLGISGLAQLDVGDMHQKRAAIDLVLRSLKYLPLDQRLNAALRMTALLGIRVPTHNMMTSEQVRALHAAGMQIGAHTVLHPILAGLSDGAARAEMLQSKQRLEHILGEQVTLFAYPNGRPEQDFTERSVEIAREIGFSAAVSTAKGAAHAGTDPLRIPRFTPWDRSRLRFGARLANNLWAARNAASR